MLDVPMKVHCGEGLGNRVAAMANGLSRADRIEFMWAVNEYCPARWHDVFPGRIAGVTFTEGAATAATEWEGLTCERWDAAGDRARANAAYGRIMHAMAGTAFYILCRPRSSQMWIERWTRFRPSLFQSVRGLF